MDTLVGFDPPRWSGPQLHWLMSHRGVASARALEIARLIPDPSDFASTWPGVRQGLRKAWAEAVPATDPSSTTPFEPVRCIGSFDADFPESLRGIPKPPAVLWVRGSLPESNRSVAIVGTRHPDEWGTAVATFAAQWCAEHGLAVVSGLALGCDTIAHEQTLAHQGTTIAVLGGSLLSPSPSKNRRLSEQILERGGGLVSEQAPDVAVSPYSLVQRNRLQVGLSAVTVVAQSGIPGGTLRTARFALEQGRTLIVARPTGDFASAAESAGNRVLTDEDGMTSDAIRAVLRTEKGFEHDLARRSPIADECPETRFEMFSALERSLR